MKVSKSSGVWYQLEEYQQLMSILRRPFLVWVPLAMRFSLGLVLFVGCDTPSAISVSRDSEAATTPDGSLRQLGAASDRNQLGDVVRIRLEYCQVTDHALRKLLAFPQLESLKITSCPRIGGKGLVPLKDLPTLQTLSLTFCPRIRDDSLRLLQNLEHLTNLSLDGCAGITDAGLLHLESLSQLRTLSLRDTWVTYDRMVDFQKKRPRCQIRHTWTAEEQVEGSHRRKQTAEFYRQLGTSSAQRGRPSAAFSALDTVVRLLPFDARAYNDRGYARKLQDKIDLAIKDYTAAIRIHPNFALAYFNRAVAYRDQGNTKKAERDFTKAKLLGYDKPAP